MTLYYYHLSFLKARLDNYQNIFDRNDNIPLFVVYYLAEVTTMDEENIDLKELVERVQRLEEDVGGIRDDLDSLSNALDMLEGDMNSMSRTIEEIGDYDIRIEQIENTSLSNEAKIGDIEKSGIYDLDEIVSDVNELRKSISDIKLDINRIISHYGD